MTPEKGQQLADCVTFEVWEARIQKKLLPGLPLLLRMGHPNETRDKNGGSISALQQVPLTTTKHRRQVYSVFYVRIRHRRRTTYPF
jgi:hypothetical protein